MPIIRYWKRYSAGSLDLLAEGHLNDELLRLGKGADNWKTPPGVGLIVEAASAAENIQETTKQGRLFLILRLQKAGPTQVKTHLTNYYYVQSYSSPK